MIIVIDGTNRDQYTYLLDQMFQLRARVFEGRLGWDVNVENGREADQFDALDPAYVIGLNDRGQVVSCVRALQTTGPHMLSDVFTSILDGEPPLRSATLWESTRFCVDTQILERGRSRNSVSYATCELMAGSLLYAMESGIADIVTVIDPVMDRVLKRSDCAPYGYVGKTVPMGKVPAMAALLDCTEERIEKICRFAGIEGDIFVSPDVATAMTDKAIAERAMSRYAPTSGKQSTPGGRDALETYCLEQIEAARTPEEITAARNLAIRLSDAGMIGGIDDLLQRAV